MVKRYAVIKNNVVDNVFIADQDVSWYQVEGAEVIDVTDIPVGPGFIRNQDGTFSRPPEEPTE